MNYNPFKDVHATHDEAQAQSCTDWALAAAETVEAFARKWRAGCCPTDDGPELERFARIIARRT